MNRKLIQGSFDAIDSVRSLDHESHSRALIVTLHRLGRWADSLLTPRRVRIYPTAFLALMLLMYVGLSVFSAFFSGIGG